jgi:NAD(P)H dehydrogenase (quinone)
MNVLIVYAHPEPSSFICALKDTAVKTLKSAGNHVEVSDLYAENFNPVAGRHDFTTIANPARFHYQEEQLYASLNNGFADDIKREQQRVRKADLMIFVFPLWWGGMPSILKGWIDRVLAYGFAYADGQRFTSGRFLNRRGIACISTGGSKQRFSDSGVYGDISRLLYPINRCLFEYMGLEVLDPFVAYAAPRVGQETREEYLLSWEKMLREISGDLEWQNRLRNDTGFEARMKNSNGHKWEQNR